MQHAIKISIDMTEMVCGKCGINFTVPEDWRSGKQETGETWYCPNGHPRAYAESDVDKAKKALEEEKIRHIATLARLNEARAAERKAVAETERLKKRVSAGVCPCCNRTFKQLARHMKTKHPEHQK